MTSIKRAIIRINLNNYIDGINHHLGYIDGAVSFLEPSEERCVSSYESIEEAEADICKTVYLSFTDTEAVIEYEFINESEEVYFNQVNFMGNVYPVNKNLFSASCYEAIVNFLHIPGSSPVFL